MNQLSGKCCGAAHKLPEGTGTLHRWQVLDMLHTLCCVLGVPVWKCALGSGDPSPHPMLFMLEAQLQCWLHWRCVHADCQVV
jgi:hypothetical protein